MPIFKPTNSNTVCHHLAYEFFRRNYDVEVKLHQIFTLLLSWILPTALNLHTIGKIVEIFNIKYVRTVNNMVVYKK